MGSRERIVVSEDGLSMPVIEVLTGRGVIFGKSGSGKSNSASVIVEELLEKGFPLLIVDVEGEYATLRDRYEVVHIGDGDEFDHKLFETDPGQIVDFCLDQNRPVIIDISDVLEIDQAHGVIENTLTVLFSREKRVQQPFLVLVEEIHEFLPQQGGLDDLGETLIRIAKRGRKRGLGLCGMSQRPAAVDKDFITQCDWIVWHRLTWENDTRVVKSILGSETAKEVQELETGEGIMMTDWDETIRRVKFRQKRTADVGDTPTLSPKERRDLTTRRSPERSTSPGGSSGTAEPVDGDGGVEESGSEGGDTSILMEPYPVGIAESKDGTDEAETNSMVSSSDFEPPAKETRPVREAPEDEGVPDQTHNQPAVATLWELGQMVTYVLTMFLHSLMATIRLGVAKATGDQEVVDRLGPVTGQPSRAEPEPSRRTVWIFVGMVLVIAVLLVFAVVFS